MKKIILSVVGAVLGMGLMTNIAKAECGEISLGSMGWASGESVSAVAKFVLEQGYGCDVKIVPTDTVPAVTSLAENGQPDIVPEVWSNSAPVYNDLVDQGKVITASKLFADGGLEGWWIPKYLADKHPELTTIQGVLANPDKVGARFHNCPVGWGCRIVNDALKVVHDLEGNGIEVFDHGSGANLAASIASAYADKAPWFGYYWGPTAVLGKYPMVKVDLGPVDIEQHTKNQKPETPKEEYGVSDYPPAPVLNAVTADLAKREPRAFAFIQNMSFPNEVLNVLLAWKEDNNASADEAAAWVLTNHKDMILGWVDGDAKKKLEALL